MGVRITDVFFRLSCSWAAWWGLIMTNIIMKSIRHIYGGAGSQVQVSRLMDRVLCCVLVVFAIGCLTLVVRFFRWFFGVV